MEVKMQCNDCQLKCGPLSCSNYGRIPIAVIKGEEECLFYKKIITEQNPP